MDRRIGDNRVTEPVRGGSRISRWGRCKLCWGGGAKSDTGTFGENVCENERIGSCWVGGGALLPVS